MHAFDYMDGQRDEKMFGKLEENLGVDGQISTCFSEKVQVLLFNVKG
jgi:hypothetical protein